MLVLELLFRQQLKARSYLAKNTFLRQTKRHAEPHEASLLVSNPNEVVEMLRGAQHDVLFLIVQIPTVCTP
jgi:hypothetical protein